MDQLSQSSSKKIAELMIVGNAQVETAAIVNILETKVGQEVHPNSISKDIRAIYDLGYFSDIQVYKENRSDGNILLKIIVKEKPSITAIDFKGLEEVKKDDIKKAMETKLYTIIDEGSIISDMRMIEKKYAEKGFFLTQVTYSLKKINDKESHLTFHVDEKGKLLVGDVHILGNHYFTVSDLTSRMALQPYTRWSASLGSGSLYQEMFLKRDVEYLSYYYKDNGFAEVKVAAPITILDVDRRFVRITFEIEEGIQYSIGELKVSGDVGEGLYSIEELIEKMKLKQDEIFRYSHFARDIEMLVDQYGDLGYAYVDVNPLTKFNKETKTVDIEYIITKGEKVYFGNLDIIGNVKTRDNVIRRELKVFDSELYSGTRLSQSKNDINRLGFFEEVQVIKERDEEAQNLLNLKFKVKEKPTGQLQAAIGYSPSGGSSSKATVFGQGKYDEKNQSGKAWNTNLTAKFGDKDSMEFETGFFDPRVHDSQWSLGINLGMKKQVVNYATGVEVKEEHKSLGLKVGRTLFEKVKGIISLRHNRIRQSDRYDYYLSDSYRKDGIKNSLAATIARRDLDNYLDPTEGSDLAITQKLTGGFLGGHYDFLETSANFDYYYPVDFTETYRTYFKWKWSLGKLESYKESVIPASDRYRLGFYDLRGYKYATVGPKDRRGLSPHSSFIDYNVGGDKLIYFQLEYFIPLIPQAGIKGVLFADAGQVFIEEDPFSFDFKKYKKDIGFGFRWLTPIAPFRFEWAYPYDDEKKSFGDMEFIFNIGF